MKAINLKELKDNQTLMQAWQNFDNRNARLAKMIEALEEGTDKYEKAVRLFTLNTKLCAGFQIIWNKRNPDNQRHFPPSGVKVNI